MEVAAEELVVRRGDRFTLGPVTLRVPEGAHLVVYGRSGSGKSTLLKALAGLVRPHGGQVLWDGQDPWGLSLAERRERQAAFGMVFQTDALFDSSTVLDNVELPLDNRGVPSHEARRRAEEALAQVGLSQAAAKYPEHLSGGMKKRTGIARAIVARPQVLLADDPLAGLDPGTARKVSGVLMEAGAGKTVLFAMTDPDPALPVERWIRLEGGRVAQPHP